MTNSSRKVAYEEKPMTVSVQGYEAVEKIVRMAGNSGRIYLPPDWVSCRVKIIRLDPKQKRLSKKEKSKTTEKTSQKEKSPE
jgi:putative transposon-encoded protein